MMLLRATLALALLTTTGAAAPQAASAEPQRFASTRPVERLDYWQQRQATISQMLADPTDMSPVKLVFLGDSITDFWLLGDNPWMPDKYCGRRVWDESFGGADPANRAINLGISGDRLEHVLFRLLPRSDGGLGQLDRADLNPDFVVLMVGINNSWDAEQPAAESVYAGIEAVVRAVHARKPNATIVLQTLLPTHETARNLHVVDPVNARLPGLASAAEFGDKVRLLDTHGAFVDASGQQIVSFFNDGLHPSESGYRAWRDRLVPFLAELRRTSSASVSANTHRRFAKGKL